MKREHEPIAIGPLVVSEATLEKVGWIAACCCLLSLFIKPGWFAGAGRGPFSLWMVAIGLSMCCASAGSFRRWIDVSVKERGLAFAGVMFVVLGAIGGLIHLLQGRSSQ